MLLISLTAKAEYYPALDYRVFGQPASTSDKVEIDKLMEQFWAAWSSQDATGVADTHTVDTEWTNAFGRSFRGSQELKEFLEERLFPMFDSDVSKQEARSYQPISRRYIGSSTAVISGRIASDRGSSVGSTNRKIQFTFIVEKAKNDWKISNQIITDLRERRS